MVNINLNKQKYKSKMINLVQLKITDTLLDNHYRLIDKIGGGGFYEVWLAEDLR